MRLGAKLCTFNNLDGHFEFGLSWTSGVRSDCPSHLKINLVACSNYGRCFMLSSKSAQYHLIFALSRRTMYLCQLKFIL